MTTIRTSDVPFKIGQHSKAAAKNPYPAGSSHADRWAAGAALRPEATAAEEPAKRTWMTWTEHDRKVLRRLAKSGVPMVELVRTLRRTAPAIESQARKLGISFKTERAPCHPARRANQTAGDGQSQQGA